MHETRRPLCVAWLTSETDTEPAPDTVAWHDLCRWLTTHDERATKSGPAWVPASLSASERGERAVHSVSCLVVDLDHETEASLVALYERLEGMGLPFVIHSTYSHEGPERAAARLVCPLAWPVPAARWRTERARLLAQLGLSERADPKTSDPSRLYFLPTARPGVEPLGWCSEAGTWLAPAAHHDTGAPLNARAGAELEGGGPERPVAIPKILALPGPVAAPKIFDLAELQAAAAKHADPDKRAMLLSFLQGTLGAQEGARNDTVHRVMSMLAWQGPVLAPEELAEELLKRMLERTKCDDEGADSFEGLLERGLHSYRRAAERRLDRDRQQAEYRQRMAVTLGRTEAPPEEGEAWREQLAVRQTQGGGVATKAEGRNLALILRHDPAFKGYLRWNELKKMPEVTGGPLAGVAVGQLDVALANWLQGPPYFVSLPRGECGAQLMHACREHAFDPVREYFEALPQWDGEERVAQMLADYCGAEGDLEHIARVSRNFMVGAVARTMSPGCQMDNVLVLQGEQGIGKSRFVRILGGEFSTSTHLDLGNKDALMVLTGHWLVELSELASLRGREVEKVKAFLTNPTDAVRLPYERAVESFPRRSVFVGTTNEQTPLIDTTGNRRFWVVAVRHVLADKLKADRDQLWAEALHLYRAGQRWHMDRDEEIVAAREAEAFLQENPLEQLIDNWWRRQSPRPSRLTINEIFERVLFKMPAERTAKEAVGIGHAMKRLGWDKVRVREQGGTRGWAWEAPRESKEGVMG